ncbi:hypothetical protein [Mycoplasma feriruminatoris]|uniref:Lipoprotein n=1 Tax=Mycoplasma feriruminatoris TaxID=1179777 RepID=A0AAX3TFG5_9MOLU|nr:hypothetical protein [Mycoplasma feriruminatoris]WFQ92713.1 hypothetical protein MFERI14822_00502 [Mycoplasma feriruminatoris]
MKKILSFLTITISLALSPSLVISCIKNNKKSATNSNNTVIKKNSDISKKFKNEAKQDSNYSKKNNNNLNGFRNEQNDETLKNNNEQGILSGEKEHIKVLLSDLSKYDEIKSYVEELIVKKQDLYNDQIKEKKWNDYKDKILNLFGQKQFQQIKEELLKLLEKTIEVVLNNKKPFEEKLKTYKDITVTEHLKDGLLVEFEFVFNTKLSTILQTESNSIIENFLEEINKLISQKNTEELKNKLFKLVDEISQLEKTQK